MKKLLLLATLLFPAAFLISQSIASINKSYLKENFNRAKVVPAAMGYQFEPIFNYPNNKYSPKRKDFVQVKIKSYTIDGDFRKEKEVQLDLSKLEKNLNSAKLVHGIRKMHIGDKYRFFIAEKVDYDPTLYVNVDSPLVKIYEVELMNILNNDGTEKYPAQINKFAPIDQNDNFDTVVIYEIAKRKAFVLEEKARIHIEQNAMARDAW